MSGNKWQVGNISVGGNAMFGDNSKMIINNADLFKLPLNCTDEASMKDNIKAIYNKIENLPEKDSLTISESNKLEIKNILFELINELQKEKKDQSKSILQQCIDKMAITLENLPNFINIINNMKSLIGL